MTTALRVVFGGFFLVMPAVTTLAQERGEERGHHEFREHDGRADEKDTVGRSKWPPEAD